MIILFNFFMLIKHLNTLKLPKTTYFEVKGCKLFAFFVQTKCTLVVSTRYNQALNHLKKLPKLANF